MVFSKSGRLTYKRNKQFAIGRIGDKTINLVELRNAVLRNKDILCNKDTYARHFADK
jgi:hypothetical protein